jgi:hypothetical protein
VDIGCGNRKTHPAAIGIDLIPQGICGTIRSTSGKQSVAEIEASGDALSIFEDSELDYIVQRHNLEHYQDPLKTLLEWQ